MREFPRRNPGHPLTVTLGGAAPGSLPSPRLAPDRRPPPGLCHRVPARPDDRLWARAPRPLPRRVAANPAEQRVGISELGPSNFPEVPSHHLPSTPGPPSHPETARGSQRVRGPAQGLGCPPRRVPQPAAASRLRGVAQPLAVRAPLARWEPGAGPPAEIRIRGPTAHLRGRTAGRSGGWRLVAGRPPGRWLGVAESRARRTLRACSPCRLRRAF